MKGHTVIEWYRAGLFGSEAEVRGALQFVRQQWLEGAISGDPWTALGMNELEWQAWMRWDTLPSRSSPPDGSLYFIRDTETGAIKIGRSSDPTRRLAELQTGHPYHLELVKVRQGRGYEEPYLHKKLAAHRLQGEWFKPCDEVMAEVRR